ncbi:hypothetical protein M514_03622 [Trichuris suis]|uniref:Uncharacterized protein n=1 Tax=Trichuris suis TaxID=68888 RepID=A0A085N0K2_9BILA|nr:hypothetical protein M513_03622 [Trichuris suis]KFD62998.1 hypothetical protein M514_03622 [Trichuris suis]
MDLSRKFLATIHYVRVICYFVAATLLTCIGILIMANCASSKFPYVNANAHGYRAQISIIGLILTFSGLALFGKTLARIYANSFDATSSMTNLTSEFRTTKLYVQPDVASTRSPGGVTLAIPNSNFPFVTGNKNGPDVCLTTIDTPPPKYEDIVGRRWQMSNATEGAKSSAQRSQDTISTDRSGTC